MIGSLFSPISSTCARLYLRGVRCEVFADAGEFPGERCERLGLVITELVTNAAKHSFHGRNDGLVRVELIKRIDSWVCVVSDNGVGTAVRSLGVGSKIVKRLVRALGGKLVRKSRRDGTSVVVTDAGSAGRSVRASLGRASIFITLFGSPKNLVALTKL
jgi:two-component sensor histidine kinase